MCRFCVDVAKKLLPLSLSDIHLPMSSFGSAVTARRILLNLNFSSLQWKVYERDGVKRKLQTELSLSWIPAAQTDVLHLREWRWLTITGIKWTGVFPSCGCPNLIVYYRLGTLQWDSIKKRLLLHVRLCLLKMSNRHWLQLPCTLLTVRHAVWNVFWFPQVLNRGSPGISILIKTMMRKIC